MAKILSVGCGDIGSRLNELLLKQGHQISGVKRHPSASNTINYIAADISLAKQVTAIPLDVDYIFFIVSPGLRSVDSYRAVYVDGIANLLSHFKQASCQPTWFFVSSTSVYAQTGGEWVDETSATQPDNPFSQLILGAEQTLITANPRNVVVRFSGIYGRRREYLLKLARQTPSIQQHPPYYTNRIHQHDCAEVLAFLLQQRLAGRDLAQCYLATDDQPVPQWEVMTWLAEQLGCPPPIPKAVTNTQMNKRCSNQRLKTLGYQFCYPGYRQGYAELIN